MYTISARRILLGATTASFSLCNYASSAGASDNYVYKPPVRVSEVSQMAAVQASKPRVRVHPKPTPRVLFILGGPGAGKGTQCAKLQSEYGFVHLSAGDLLREERARGGPQAELIESTIREGRIVPVEITVRLIKAAMDASPASKL